jgi:hypothetical protein
MKTRKTTKSKVLTINDIVAPGDVLDLLRSTLDSVSTIEGLVIIVKTSAGVVTNYAGLDEYQVVGVLELGKFSLLKDEDDEQ